MKYLALINAQVYYGTDCYYGRLFYIKVFDDLEGLKAVAQKYVDDQYKEINTMSEDTFPIFEAEDIDKAWECCCAWVKNPTGINLIDGCEGVSHSAGVISIEEEKLI